jgi:1-acyl-sn-glycerol-3-phosphate acyltransferase
VDLREEGASDVRRGTQHSSASVSVTSKDSCYLVATMSDKPVAMHFWESFAHKTANSMNETALGRKIQVTTLRTFSYAWVRQVIARRMLAHGLDEILTLQPDRGVLFVANHRTFFDLYCLMLACYMGPAPWAKQLNFPVRSNFFYDSPLGVVVNYLCCGASMYPPIYRQPERRAQNDESLDKIVDLLKTPGNVIGLHPEGTRGQGDDPYTFLPAQPGVGKMALLAQPLIIPMFVNGLSNDFIADSKLTWKKNARQIRPIIGIFGKPIDYSKFLADKPRPALYKKCADYLMAEVHKLTPLEQDLRAQCVAGQISDDDPRWLSNRKAVHPLYARPG